MQPPRVDQHIADLRNSIGVGLFLLESVADPQIGNRKSKIKNLLRSRFGAWVLFAVYCMVRSFVKDSK